MTKTEKYFYTSLFLIVCIIVGFLVANSQESKYQATEVQRLRLQVKQRDAQIAQKDLFIAQQNFQTSLKALNDEAARVKVENKWPDGLVFDQEKLSFTEDRSKE